MSCRCRRPIPTKHQLGGLVVAAQVELRHATTVAIGDAAALLVGASGTGKSDLALRCLSLAPSQICPEPFSLVSDDQTELRVADGRILASAPPTIAGKLEVRGLGIIDIDWRDDVEVVLVANLTQHAATAHACSE